MIAATLAFAFLQVSSGGCASVNTETWTSAQRAIASQHSDSAVRILEPLEAGHSSCWKLHVLLGRARYQQGAYPQAAHHSELAATLAPGEFDAILFRGEVLTLQGRSVEAQRMLEKACKLRPNSAEAQFQLGIYWDGRKVHAPAAAAFRKVVAARPADARAWDFLALHLEALGKLDEAEAAYRSGLAVNSGRFLDAYLDYNYGRLLAKRNHLDESLKHLDHALVLAPPTRAIHYERARVLLRLARATEARRDAEKALSLPDPGGFILDLQVYNLLVQVYARLGERDLAESYAERARKAVVPLQGRDRGVAAVESAPKVPDAATADIEASKQLIAEGKLQDAIRQLRKLVAAEPANADAHLLLGTALALLPSRGEAIAELQRAVDLRPDFARGHYTLAVALARFNEFENAREAYERALALDPALTAAHVQLAMVLAAEGKMDTAIEHFSAAIAAGRDAAETGAWHYLRAKAYLQLKETRKAATDLELAVQLEPRHAKAWLELGLARMELGEEAGALQPLQEAVELEPGDPEAQMQLGAYYQRGGDAAQAVTHLREAARLRPNDRQTLYTLAKALQASGDTAAAQPILEQLAQTNQTQNRADPELVRSGGINNEGVALEREGKFAEALERYRAALAISPDQLEFRRNFALVLCRLNRWEEAIPQLKSILKDVPGDVAATKALYVALEHAPELK